MLMLATSSFGLEALVASELRELGLEVSRVEDARVFFEGDWQNLARANLWLRCADRVYLVIGSFEAKSFEQLFEGVKALPWEDYLTRDASFPVKGKSAKSTLKSVSDCQAICKKAIVERLKNIYHCEWFDETGPRMMVEVALLKDEALLCLDASGSGLHRRGYRTLSGPAPLRETLAAALLHLARYAPQRMLWDPFCGSGTIAVEAAMMARRIAPGLSRDFDMQRWPIVPAGTFEQGRQQARESIDREAKLFIWASDVDESMVSMARYHAGKAGVERDIHIQRLDIRQVSSARKNGILLCNPPYGERMLEKDH
ncbi:MAG: THUMP domain-containing class I SAM-dependent RNA methyltransferase, partial [Christensenellales bacterium]